jgi:hypothetical protein
MPQSTHFQKKQVHQEILFSPSVPPGPDITIMRECDSMMLPKGDLHNLEVIFDEEIYQFGFLIRFIIIVPQSSLTSIAPSKHFPI